MYNNCPVVKNLYKRQPMRVTNSSENSEQNMNDLYHGLRFISSCIDIILVLTKGYWVDHAQKL